MKIRSGLFLSLFASLLFFPANAQSPHDLERAFVAADTIDEANLPLVLDKIWGCYQELSEIEESFRLTRDTDGTIRNDGDGEVRTFELDRIALHGYRGNVIEILKIAGRSLIVKRIAGGDVAYLACRIRKSEEPPCGLAGTFEERSLHCLNSAGESARKTFDPFRWHLVTRTIWGTEIWRDETSGLTVSEALLEKRRLEELFDVGTKWWSPRSKTFREKSESPCRIEETSEERGNLADLSWHIPTEEEFEALEAHGLRDVVPSLGTEWFWTSSSESIFSEGLRGYDASKGKVYGMCYRKPYAVLCVAGTRS